MDKCFTRKNWQNEPSAATPLSAANLNELDYAANEMDNRIITLDTTKAKQSDLLQSLKGVTYNATTGVFTFTWQNGTTLNVDLNIEKIPVAFSMSDAGVITMTNSDGTTYTCNVGSLIHAYNFVDSDQIDFTATLQEDGSYSVTGSIKDGSITESMIDPDYLAEIEANVNAAAASASAADGFKTTAATKAAEAAASALAAQTAAENAEAIALAAQTAAENAEAIVGIGIATTEQAGIVKPDGTSVTIDADGTIHAGIAEETDPTVPTWAKQATKPTYTAAEVGALGATDQAVDSMLFGGYTPAVYQKKSDSTLETSNKTVAGAINEVRNVAIGKPTSYAFDTVAELDAWLGVAANKAKLKTGDNFFIRALDVPDYWWDATTDTKQILETTKVDLTDYAKTVDTGSKSNLTTDAKGNLVLAINEVKSETTSQNESLGGMTFGVDSNGNYGYIKAGADSVTPFKSVTKLADVPRGGSSSYDCSFNISALYPNYKNITVDNIIVEPSTNLLIQTGNFTKSYDANTGVILVQTLNGNASLSFGTANIYII